MFRCEFRLAGDDSLVGTKEMESLPEADDEVTVEGKTYKVEEPPNDPSADPIVIRVRKPFSI